jgi:hypothetical protein
MSSSLGSKIKDALPSHLKPGNGAEGERHHGKSQSHVVSWEIVFCLRCVK